MPEDNPEDPRALAESNRMRTKSGDSPHRCSVPVSMRATTKSESPIVTVIASARAITVCGNRRAIKLTSFSPRSVAMTEIRITPATVSLIPPAVDPGAPTDKHQTGVREERAIVCLAQIDRLEPSRAGRGTLESRDENASVHPLPAQNSAPLGHEHDRRTGGQQKTISDQNMRVSIEHRDHRRARTTSLKTR